MGKKGLGGVATVSYIRNVISGVHFRSRDLLGISINSAAILLFDIYLCYMHLQTVFYVN